MDQMNSANGIVPAMYGQPASPTVPFNFSDDPSSRTLYIGNLDIRTSERMLFDIFTTCSPVVSAKIVNDKSNQQATVCYGFIEFYDRNSAELALTQMNGRKIFDHEIKVNWAFSSGGQVREDTSTHSHVFVGDLSPEVNDQVLAKAFNIFPSMSVARVMWDVSSGRSRGYGFVAFRNHADAERAINTMNGECLGTRPIRVNWANQKVSIGSSRSTTDQPTSSPNTQSNLSFESVLSQAAPHNSTVYCGNITPFTLQEQLLPLFSSCGYVVDIKMQADRGFAFVKMDTHENAAMAIVTLTGTVLNGRPLKCSWGKDQYSYKLNGYQHLNNPSYVYPYAYGMPQQPYPAPVNQVMSHGGMMVKDGAMQPPVNGAMWGSNPAAAAAAGYTYDPYSYYSYGSYPQQQDPSQQPPAAAADPSAQPPQNPTPSAPKPSQS
ncbi:hypothetical protein BB560_004203 [Smittium megazygosporum]|uniref:RRM domain-containing protein n=1 Tax=Smittium megazygosporum TaxID=133381 RepID=A0A2T9Z9U2_9FUNG|nr:hypothetical protein BB560_004203 [Smittium megazygosporum]